MTRDSYAGTPQERRAATTQIYFLAFLELGSRIAARDATDRLAASVPLLETGFRAGRATNLLSINLGQAEESGERRRLDELVSILGGLGMSFGPEDPQAPPRTRTVRRRRRSRF